MVCTAPPRPERHSHSVDPARIVSGMPDGQPVDPTGQAARRRRGRRHQGRVPAARADRARRACPTPRPGRGRAPRSGRRLDGGEPVGDGDRRAPAGQLVERRLQVPLGGGVERARRLVEDEHRGSRRMVRATARRCCSPPENRCPRAADDRLQPVGQRGDQLGDLGRLQRRARGRRRWHRGGEEQVVADRRVHEVGLLRDDAHDRGEHLRVDVAHVDAVDVTWPTVGSCRRATRAGQGRLAGSGRPDQRQRRALRDNESHVGDGVTVGTGIAEASRPRARTSPRTDAGSSAHRVRRRGHVGHEVEVLEDPAEQGHRRHPLGADVEQAHERPEDAVLQRGEGDRACRSSCRPRWPGARRRGR